MEKCASYIVGATLSLSAKSVVMREPAPTSKHTKKNQASPNDKTKKNGGDYPATKMVEPEMTSKKAIQHVYYLEVGDDDDDTTCSTTSESSSSDDDELLEDAGNGSVSMYRDCCQSTAEIVARNSVSFATPLISDIHYRPRTLRQDKPSLYYCDVDYRIFRREAHREQQRTENDRMAIEQQQRQVDSAIRRRRQQRPVDGHRRCVQFSPEIVTSVWEYETEERDDASFWYSESEIQHFLDEFVESLVIVTPSSPYQPQQQQQPISTTC